MGVHIELYIVKDWGRLANSDLEEIDRMLCDASDFYCELEANSTKGTHPCGLCRFDAPHFSKNLFIPYEGKIYVCPEAITHYMCITLVQTTTRFY